MSDPHTGAPLDAPVDLPEGLQLGRTQNVEKAVARFGFTRVKAIADGYCRGDELGYAAWKALASVEGGTGAGREMVRVALFDGIDAVKGAPDELVALFDQVDTVPDWVDWSQLHRGAVAYWRAGRLVPAALVYGGTGPGFTYGGTRPFVFSQSFRRDTAGKRLIETLRWLSAATTPDAMRRNARGFGLTVHVRLVHAAVRDFCTKSNEWDWHAWGVPINLSDGVFQGGGLFCGGVVNALTKLGVRFSTQERADIYALWRYINHVIGFGGDLNYIDEQDMDRKAEVSSMLETEPDELCQSFMHGIIGFLCEDKIDYKLLPALLEDRLSPDQKKELTYGIVRGVCGDKLSDQFLIPRNNLHHLLPVIRTAVRGAEVARRFSRTTDATRCESILSAFSGALRQQRGEPAVTDAERLQAVMAANEHRAGVYRRV
jgi:hypothetical protein